MILFSRLIGTCGFLRYAERSRSVRYGYCRNIFLLYASAPLSVRKITNTNIPHLFYWRGNFYFKMMKGYKIGGRDFILKTLQQSPKLPVTPEQKIFSSWQKWHRKFRQRQRILRKIKRYWSAISDLQ